MTSVNEYKRFENNLVQKVKKCAFIVVSGIWSFLCGAGRVLTRPYTVVLVPHSEKRVYNLRITLFSVMLFFLVVVGAIGVFFHYGNAYSPSRVSVSDNDQLLQSTQASLDYLREEVNLLLREARNFEPALLNTISALKKDVNGLNNSGAVTGDLATFFGNSRSDIQEIEDIRRLREYMKAASLPLYDVGAVLDSQSALLTEIPSVWPVKGGIGRISQYFGQNPDPFTGQSYIHKGIDISNQRQGDPIVATADGQVASVEFEQGGLGNNVIIRHRHGFYTRYAHMLSFRVRAGDRVQQGDVIGYIGNTGLSTGPHLHYEIHIGSDIVDPYRYITMRSSSTRAVRR